MLKYKFVDRVIAISLCAGLLGCGKNPSTVDSKPSQAKSEILTVTHKSQKTGISFERTISNLTNEFLFKSSRLGTGEERQYGTREGAVIEFIGPKENASRICLSVQMLENRESNSVNHEKKIVQKFLNNIASRPEFTIEKVDQILNKLKSSGVKENISLGDNIVTASYVAELFMFSFDVSHADLL